MVAFIGRTTRRSAVIASAAVLLGACDGRALFSRAGPVGPSLRSMHTYGLLAGSTVICGGPLGAITADVGLWPGSVVSGFPTCTIYGTSNTANAAAQAAQGDLTTAYQALTDMACGTTLSADLGGMTLAPGVYCSTSTQGLTGTVTLDGQGRTNATFVIQVVGALTVSGAVDLIGGAEAKNVWWQVGSATIGTSSIMEGNILALQSITMNDYSTLIGRALARDGSVTMGSGNTISPQ